MNGRHFPLIIGSFIVSGHAFAHSWKASETPVFNEALRAHILADWQKDHSDKQSATPQFASIADATNVGKAPTQASHFTPFAPKVQVKWDNDFLYIESNGLPAHNMMVGITAWQQQVPLPQPYTGDNAWRLPLKPVVAKTPQVVENHFLRGAIAIGVNGIPIFNPQNNRGEVSYEIGELDQWGGHCGRADDYHYHIAPLHLESVVGKGKPVAYALDGYPIYGLTEPDGSTLRPLDECHGHEDAKLGYHYHASTKRPYLQSAFHGEVVEADGQVDPQPRAQGVREALQALRGAKITGYESTGPNSYKLSYEVNGDKRSVAYTISADGTYPFEFDNGREGKTKEVYTQRRGPPAGPQREGGGKGKGGKGGKGRPGDNPPPRPESVERKASPAANPSGIMDANGDGIVSAAEFAEAAKRAFAQGGKGTLADALQKAREQFTAFDHNQDGQLDRPELDELVGKAPEGDPPARNEDAPKRDAMKRGEGGSGGRGGKKEAFVESKDQPRSSNGTFMLTSPVMEDLTEMPKEYTGDGEASTLPLDWKGAPAGTQSYALIMDHSDPEGQKKWYWTLYDIPSNITSLPKNAQGIGKVGTGFKGQIGYEPPHSKGPGAKTYVITMYALSAPLSLTQSPREVNREVLLTAMQGKVLASSSLRVVHTSSGNADTGSGKDRPRSETAMNNPPPSRRDEPPADRGAPPPDTAGGQRKPWIQMHGAELDTDHDGNVTAAEVAADMKKAFAMYDANHDNTITPKEIDAAGDLREGAAFAGFIYRHAIDLDANNDSALTPEEALAAAKYIFASADQDHDGKITTAEIASAPNAPLPVPPGGAPAAASAPPPGNLRPLDNIFAQPTQGTLQVAQTTTKSGDAPPPPQNAGDGKGGKGKGKGGGGGGKGGPDNKGLIKPSMADTIKVNVYADNWFMLYINGKLTAVDSIDFIPHNVVTVDILPEYPMTIAVMAKDNADAKTGMEYGDHIGDGGFIIKFADGTVSNASWKAKCFFKGPLNHDAANPKVEHTPIPENWFAVDFDDSQWPNATEYTEERVNPKAPFYDADFAGAKFIWSEDLDLDNTILFRTKIDKPGWTKRWNTKPDLTVPGSVK
jgi:phosphatidylethanolamine-binding protein (PEBP) family uncharacterized protein/Ca2+-binding EF-hand superfamily protein